MKVQKYWWFVFLGSFLAIDLLTWWLKPIAIPISIIDVFTVLQQIYPAKGPTPDQIIYPASQKQPSVLLLAFGPSWTFFVAYLIADTVR